MRTPIDPNTERRSRPINIGGRMPTDPNILADRVVFLGVSVSVWAWPSRGGLIVLHHATALDFEFLGFDQINPPIYRDPDQVAEDRLCQRLLLLGATWYDSRNRYIFIANVEDEKEIDVDRLESGEAKKLTLRERRWVSVGYPSGVTSGGLWVLEYDSTMYGFIEKDNLQPNEAAKVYLASTMDMKCEILKGMGAKFFASLEEYDGYGCLKAWEEKTEGEIGALVKTNIRGRPLKE